MNPLMMGYTAENDMPGNVRIPNGPPIRRSEAERQKAIAAHKAMLLLKRVMLGVLQECSRPMLAHAHTIAQTCACKGCQEVRERAQKSAKSSDAHP